MFLFFFLSLTSKCQSCGLYYCPLLCQFHTSKHFTWRPIHNQECLLQRLRGSFTRSSVDYSDRDGTDSCRNPPWLRCRLHTSPRVGGSFPPQRSDSDTPCSWSLGRCRSPGRWAASRAEDPPRGARRAEWGWGKEGSLHRGGGRRTNNKTAAAAAAVVTDEGLFKTETRVTGFHSVPMTCEIVGNDKQANRIERKLK